MLDYEDSESKKMRGKFRDWRKALSTPTTYRVGNAVRVQPKFILLMVSVMLFLMVSSYFYIWSVKSVSLSNNQWSKDFRTYNFTYPITKPIESNGITTFRIGLIADLDTNSKSEKAGQWYSHFKKGYLTYNPNHNSVMLSWDQGDPVILKSGYSHKGRGMELSELITFDGRLLTFDDRSGMVFEIVDSKIVPWVVLADGDGFTEKGFKSEWATVKDELLYVGSMGKEWTTAGGDFENFDPMWIKTISKTGEVRHINWLSQYKSIRSSIGIKWPGYMIHESGAWSDIMSEWFFLPRRCSSLPYNETRDEKMGCNYLITADENFTVVNANEIVSQKPTHGFSSFKFIPGSKHNAIVALRTTELDGRTMTYIMAFTKQGHVLLPETFVANEKYEGFEFI